MLFGSKKPDQETVLLLDIESGSVGGALALLARGQKPKLFGETRLPLPLSYGQNTATLLPQIEKAVRDALVHAAQVAGRLRSNESDKISALGRVSRASVFLSAPWGRPNLNDHTQQFFSPLQTSLSKEIDAYLGVGTTFHTGADVAAYGAGRLFAGEPLLLCIVRGETTELILLGEKRVEGYATVPNGINTVLRTLKSHGGMSVAESHSIFSLAMNPHTPPYEPLETAAQCFVEEFAGVAQHLLQHGSVGGVLVVAPHTLGDWFAQALSRDESLASHFPQGGTVRAVRAHHLQPHIDAHHSLPDMHLLLSAFFVNKA